RHFGPEIEKSWVVRLSAANRRSAGRAQAIARSFDSSTKFRRIRYFAKGETGNFVVTAQKVLIGPSAILRYRTATIILHCTTRESAATRLGWARSALPLTHDPSRGATMRDTYSPHAALEQARDSFRKATKEFESFKLDTTVPESVRALAEKTVNQSREAYERGKDALGEATAALERSFDAAGQGATAFNRKLIDLAQRNLNSAFDLAKSLAGAKNLAEILELQTTFLRHQFDVFANQAGEIRALSSKIVPATAEPIKNQVTRSLDAIRK